MILIVDGGSTKTDWCFCDGADVRYDVKTQGINPCHQEKELIVGILQKELVPYLPESGALAVSDIYYYGAGCATTAICNELASVLKEFFCNAMVQVCSDMLGAARALCGKSEGIACVLGTGSNSCLYNGNEIIDQIPSLGYILGDEGSSAALGRRLISDCLKRQMPKDISDEFMRKYDLTQDIIIENVYRHPMANRYMAEYSRFLTEKRNIDQIHKLLVHCFTEFFQRNVIGYHRPWLPVNFTGSIANAFTSELSEAAESVGMTVGVIMQSPIDGLRRYHLNLK